MKDIIYFIQGLITKLHQDFCPHKKVSAYPHTNGRQVLLICDVCGKFTPVNNPGEFWNVDDLADKHMRLVKW